MTTPPGDLPLVLRAALALYRATRAQSDTSAAALAAASGLSVDQVLEALAPVAEQGIIIACPVAPRTAPPEPSTWVSLRDRLSFEMLPWLPSILEGLLEYSPADDEARVRAAIGDERPGPQDRAALAASLGLPFNRVDEALTRLEHRDIEREEAMGTRMRVVLEVTFPDYLLRHDEPRGFFHDMMTRWTKAIEENGAVRCTDVMLRECSNMPFRFEQREYEAWRYQKRPEPTPGGGLAGTRRRT